MPQTNPEDAYSQALERHATVADYYRYRRLEQPSSASAPPSDDARAEPAQPPPPAGVDWASRGYASEDDWIMDDVIERDYAERKKAKQLVDELTEEEKELLRRDFLTDVWMANRDLSARIVADGKKEEVTAEDIRRGVTREELRRMEYEALADPRRFRVHATKPAKKRNWFDVMIAEWWGAVKKNPLHHLITTVVGMFLAIAWQMMGII